MKQIVDRSHLMFWHLVLAGCLVVWPILLGMVPRWLDSWWVYGLYAMISLAVGVSGWRIYQLEKRHQLQTYAQILAFIQNEAETAPTIQKSASRWWHGATLGKRWQWSSLYTGYTIVMMWLSLWFFKHF